MAVTITQERPDTSDARTLIAELEAHLAPQYPAESRHGLSVERLLVEAVAFFVLRADGFPAACGGIKFFDGTYGELKRMYVRPQFRGAGYAKAMVNYLSEYARTKGIMLVRLETGIHQHEAIGLYERMNFRRTTPFGNYKPDPLSIFFEKHLE